MSERTVLLTPRLSRVLATLRLPPRSCRPLLYVPEGHKGVEDATEVPHRRPEDRQRLHIRREHHPPPHRLRQLPLEIPRQLLAQEIEMGLGGDATSRKTTGYQLAQVLLYIAAGRSG